MTAPKSKYPISSFGPELMAFLIKAGREKIVLKFVDEGEPRGKGKKIAHSFQRRVHTLRSKMREAKHPDYALASRARVSIFWGPDAIEHGAPEEWRNDHKGDRGALIVGRPHDSEFRQALEGVGIAMKGAPPMKDVEEPSDSPPTIEPDEAPSLPDDYRLGGETVSLSMLDDILKDLPPKG